MTAPIEVLFDAIRDVEAQWKSGELERDDVVTLWLDVVQAVDQLTDLAKLVGDDAAGTLLDRDDPRSEYRTSHGELVHLTPGYAPERWQGWQLVQRLGQPFVDRETGEVVTAVPVPVLLDVLPGCAAPDATSSRWRTTGLRRHFEDWQRYRSKDDPPLVIRRGAPW